MKVIKAIGSLIGLGPSAPTVDTSQAQGEVNNAQKDAQNVRAQLFATAGGAAGENLSPGQVAPNRGTLFGN